MTPRLQVSETHMSDDTSFLRALHADPLDDELRLVYADWLEEHGGPESAAKAEFLRLTAEPAAHTVPKGGAAAGRQERLQQLAAGLDTDGLAVVSRLAVENCAGAEETRRKIRRVRFDFLCGQRWEQLQATEDRAVRFCDACGQNVHYCDTITEAREHAWDGHCIALDLGVIRRTGDLQPRLMSLGRPSAESLRREEERMRPDPVSAERERRKQRKEDGEGAVTGKAP